MRPELDKTAPAPAASDPPDQTRTANAKPRPRSLTSELPSGLRLGHFKIERKLGAGGMGEVYLASDLALDRPVAIKVLPSGVASGNARERMIKEARAQARVHHPNVAHIYFIGEEEGRLYFAMEYLTGKTLADRVADGPIPVEEALAIVRAAALGLREAQRSGFTHRDVKPSNLMVDGHGVVKVLDFGLAHGAPERVSEGPLEQTTFAGTPLYMAPEQASGEAIDFRADIYALGATLYHLVSGRPPFVAENVNQLLTLHATAARPNLPRGKSPRTTITALDALIARMMAPEPADRFSSYDELLRAIELVSNEHTRPAGFWVRAMASAIDSLLVVLALVLVQIIREIALTGRGDIEVDRYASLLVTVLGVIAIGRWGTTPGKSLFELEVVSLATSERPSWSQAIRRELTLGGVPLVFASAAEIADRTGYHADVFAALELASLVLLIALLLHAALRVPGKRPPWDRVAGTMVRYRTTRRTGRAAS